MNQVAAILSVLCVAVVAQQSVADANATSTISLLQVSASLVSGPPKLKVAFTVFITDVADAAFKDALTVMAYSAQRAIQKSRHSIDLIALVPERMTSDGETFLKATGFKEVMKKPVPVLPAEIQGEAAKREMQKTNGQGVGLSFAQAEETIKYWGLADTRYDRVLVIDADVLVLDPMDDLLEREEDFVATYDHGLDEGMSSTMPPAQGGFLLFRPNMSDFEAVKALTREGDWGGNGWKDSGIGFCYGGVGPDGLLAYYFNQKALEQLTSLGKSSLPEGSHAVQDSRMFAADRVAYDVVVNARLNQDLSTVQNRDTAIAAVKSVHFTGNCIKPWTCFNPQDWFCKGLVDTWWALRGELAAQRGVPTETIDQGREGACHAGVYDALPEKTV